MRVLNMNLPSQPSLMALLSFTALHIGESAIFPASSPPKLENLHLPKMDDLLELTTGTTAPEVEGHKRNKKEERQMGNTASEVEDHHSNKNEEDEMGNTASEVEVDHTFRPVVYVQDFLPLPNLTASPTPTLDDLNLTMHAIYGSPVCPGNKTSFVGAKDAPPGFCRYTNGQLSMAMEGHRDDDFDQYAMERIMLAKWLRSPLRCHRREEWCRANADIVVVPSLALHNMVQGGFTWDAYANLTGVDAYWATLREMFYIPEKNRTPLIVIHSAYSWDWAGYNEVLRALAEEPIGFIMRVVIASTGSNVHPAERVLFGREWTDSGISLLRQRFDERRNGGVATDGGPLLLTVPYPTSLLGHVRFTESVDAYSADRNRPIRVSMYGSANKDGRGSNWIRQNLLDRVASKPNSESHSQVNMVCNEPATNGTDSMCGLSRGSEVSMWTITSNSAFCLEPAGDSLCRSHFYISLLSGCIPVIVDGGHDLFDPEVPTWWAWRGTSEDFSSPSPFPDEIQSALVDYKESFVVIPAEELRNGTDIIQTLVEMPEKDPERYRRLRENVDRVAPLMRYSYYRCSSYPSTAHPNWCRDAFAVFQSIVALESYHARH